MVRWLTLLVILLIPIYAGAILGDLNRDGQVDFGDFFLFADQFGKKGAPDPPDTVVTVRVDTLRQTLRDTVTVTKVDTVRRTLRDTVTVLRVDTLRQVVEHTVRDTVELVRHDTIKSVDESHSSAQFSFDNQSDIDDWEETTGVTVRIEGGQLAITGSIAGFNSELFLPISFAGDLDISVDALYRQGDDTKFGLYFRDWYCFGISPSGAAVGLKPGSGQPISLLDWTYTPLINRTGFNNLRVVIKGDRLSFYINGSKIGEVTDLSLAPSGRIGLFVGGLQEVVFDNLVVIASPQQIFEHEVVIRDTVTIRQVVRDTVVTTVFRTDTVLVASDSDRPPIRSWSAIATEAEPAIYWLGVSTTTSNSTLFLGTGFAYSGTDIATNAHVAVGLIDLANRLEAIGAVPILVAIRARTFAYGSGTYILSRGATSHPDYDGTVNSADVADLLLHSSETKRFPSRLRMAPRTAILGINSGDEIATLGFPGELETETLDALLQPIPTFKTGSVSALRPYRSTTRSWRVSNKIVQHNLDLTPGTSGSPIFNNRGEVIAINNAGVTGTSLGFAIRADELREMLEADKIDYPSLYSDLRLKKVFLPPLDRGLDGRSLLELLSEFR